LSVRSSLVTGSLPGCSLGIAPGPSSFQLRCQAGCQMVGLPGEQAEKASLASRVFRGSGWR
jgi:hypothetical protein